MVLYVSGASYGSWARVCVVGREVWDGVAGAEACEDGEEGGEREEGRGEEAGGINEGPGGGTGTAAKWDCFWHW